MILAAGLGTRLRPLTNTLPKALVKIGGKTLLEIAITHLMDHGVSEIIVNVHHFADQIVSYLDQQQNFGIKISISDERDLLLDTGGGVKNASWFFKGGDPFFVRNVDVISDLDLSSMMEQHLHSKGLATLAVRKRETSRYLLFDHEERLCGWMNVKTGEKKMSRGSFNDFEMLAFSGIQILNPGIFPLISEKGSFSLIDLYLRLANNTLIRGYTDEGQVWEDAGKLPESV